MHRPASFVLVALIALAACGGDDAATSATTVDATSAGTVATATADATAPTTVLTTSTTATSTTMSPPPTTTVPTTSTAPAVAPPAAEALMPSVMCMNLQDAQDTIQRAGVFYSRSEDATGRGRNQVLDSNWQVVAQNPSPGAPIGEGDAVLSVVKYGETSPCP
jgi:hypothetical protein